LVSINISNIREDTIKIIGKGNKERTLYLDPICRKAIDDWLEVRKTINPLLDMQALFVSAKRRNRLTPRRIQKIIEQCLKMAGLSGNGYSTHKLRHTSATLMYDGGADILELQQILGHEHTTTTEIYTHVNNKRLKNAVANNPLNK